MGRVAEEGSEEGSAEMKIKIQSATLKNLKDIQDLNHQLCIKEHKEFDSTINKDFPVQPAGGYSLVIVTHLGYQFE